MDIPEEHIKEKVPQPQASLGSDGEMNIIDTSKAFAIFKYLEPLPQGAHNA